MSPEDTNNVQLAQAEGDPNPPGTDWEYKNTMENYDQLHREDSPLSPIYRQGVVNGAYKNLLHSGMPHHTVPDLLPQLPGPFGGHRWGLPSTEFQNGIVFTDRNQDGAMDMASFHDPQTSENLVNYGNGENFNADWVPFDKHTDILPPPD